jgi:hypothetical protein
MPLFKKQNKKAEHHKAGNLQNPKILEVNLIKDEAQVSFDWSRNFLFLALVLGLAFILVVELYMGLDWWAKQEETRLQALVTQTDQLNAATVKLRNEAAEAISYKNKSLIFGDLLGRHIYWSAFFSWLEKNTLSTVKYEGFQGDLSGQYEFKAKAPSYSEASWQASLLLQDPLVKKVTIREATAEFAVGALDTDGVAFDLSLEINPDIFRK